jgi:tRNA U55 pseudouridine synthase TruB
LFHDGVLLVDKPAGMTSHDVVARERRELPPRRRSATPGTLDPFADRAAARADRAGRRARSAT